MKSSTTFCTRIFTVILAGAILTSRAAEEVVMTQAPEKPLLPWEKGSVAFGGFVTAFDSKVGFGINNAAGVVFNAEQLLGLETHLTVMKFGAMYRPGKSLRHQLDFSYASYHRSGSATLTEEINIDGITIPVGADIDTIFNFDIIRGTYSYALLQDDRMRISVGLGLYAVPLKYGVDFETSGGRQKVEGADVTVPLPAFALRGDFQLVSKLFLYSSIDAMYLEIDDFTGSLLEINLGLEYRPWKHFGLGLGYSSMAVSVEAQSASDYPGANFVGAVDVSFSGLMVYGKLLF